MWSKGFAAEETKAAFARVGDFSVSAENRSGRFAAYDGQCLASVLRGDLSSARETAELFLQEAEAEGSAMEAEVARSRLGFVLLNQGDLIAARSVFERVLANYIPERDGETRFRFGRDTEVSAASCLALVEWHLGEAERARQLLNRAFRRADELGSIPATVVALYWKVRFESHRHDAAAARRAADALLALTEEHRIRTYAELGWIYANWASGQLLDPEAGAAGLNQCLDAYMAQSNKLSVPYFYGLLAELKAKAQRPDYALTLIDRGLAIAGETGEHLFDPCLHRLRGDILSRPGEPANPALAEEAFRTAIALAREQGARTYELLASLSLAKFYQSTGRPIEAQVVLAPALKGFSPTAEIPEIAEAKTLLERLSAADEGVGDRAGRRSHR
jgi:adenylate cyclase